MGAISPFRSVRLIQSKLCLAIMRIGPMARETTVGKNRKDVLVERHLLAKGSNRSAKNNDNCKAKVSDLSSEKHV